jgi:hypothetical protein
LWELVHPIAPRGTPGLTPPLATCHSPYSAISAVMFAFV